MQNRRDWLRSSLGIGGLLLAPSNLLTAQEKTDFNPRPLEPVIRLSSNENPYGPSKRVQERIKNSFVHGCRYPYAYSDDLESILAKKHGVSPESIIVTGGSTEGLKIAGVRILHSVYLLRALIKKELFLDRTLVAIISRSAGDLMLRIN